MSVTPPLPSCVTLAAPLQVFFLAAAATVVGSLLSFQVVSGSITSLGALAGLHGPGAAEQGWRLAAALVAKNIGGGMSYIAGEAPRARRASPCGAGRPPALPPRAPSLAGFAPS